MATVTHYVADTENCVPKSALYVEEINNVLESEFGDDFVLPTPTYEEDPGPDERDWRTHVWCTGFAPVGATDPDEVVIRNSLSGFFQHLNSIKGKSIVWFHNLAWDGPLLIYYLLSDGYTRSMNGRGMLPSEQEKIAALIEEGKIEEADDLEERIQKRADSGWKNPERGTFSTTISDTGTWYSMKVTLRNNRTIEFRDSLKILPFTVDTIAKSLKTKAQKLVGTIDYAKFRPVGYEPDETEVEYVVNDILVMSEALGMLASREVNLLDSLTIGSACMSEFYRILGKGDKKKGKKKFRLIFDELDPKTDAQLRPAYHGGFCYVHADGDIVDLRGTGTYGTVSDVNSLYPSVMKGHRYPVGLPRTIDPDEFEDRRHSVEWVAKMQVDFTVKPDHIPFIQVKGSIWQENEHLRSSEGPITLTFTRPEYELFLEQYDVAYQEVTAFWTFASANNVFDEYIDYWYEVKNTATNPVDRMIAKLMLNNLYGKMAQGMSRNGGVPYIDDKGVLRYRIEHATAPGGHIAAGAYITAYAKAVTVRAAQANYDNFLYADTDSLHIIGEPKAIAVGKGLGEWDPEARWDMARYVRQKTYIERLIYKKKPLDEPEIDIKAAGAPPAVKTRMLYKVTEYKDGQWLYYRLQTDENDEITSPKRDTDEVFERFTFGLSEAGKLRRVATVGGPILEETTFKIHPVDDMTLDPYTGLYRIA